MRTAPLLAYCPSACLRYAPFPLFFKKWAVPSPAYVVSLPATPALDFSSLTSYRLQQVVREYDHLERRLMYPKFKALRFWDCSLDSISDEFIPLYQTVTDISVMDTEGSLIIPTQVRTTALRHPWPALEKITFGPYYISPGMGWLCNIVQHHKAIGHPLKTVQMRTHLWI